jgi:tetratricopeptide (TPR) repeat protein
MAKKNEQVQAQEQVVESLNKSEAFFLKYKKPIIAAIVALIVIIVGFMLVKQYVLEPRENEASTALAKGQELMNAQQFDKALKGDGATFGGFLKIASDYSGTDAGNLANLYAGLCYANQEKPDWKKALEYVEQFDTKGDQLISPASQMALGDIYANNDQLDKAVESFKKAADMADGKAEDKLNYSIAPLALRKAGIILESQNKKAEANAIYKQIKEKYINSPIRQDIDKYIERTAE